MHCLQSVNCSGASVKQRSKVEFNYSRDFTGQVNTKVGATLGGVCEGVSMVNRTENLRKIRRKILTLERGRWLKKKKKM